MAHIPDGVLSFPVLAGGAVLAAGGIALGLRAIGERDLPKTGLLSAAFFVVSLITVPLGPSSVHLLLGGLMGLILGIRIFPAVFVGLLLQAAFFGFGGLTTLGVDTLNMALPGYLLAALARPLVERGSAPVAALAGGIVAALSVLATAAGVAVALGLSAASYAPAAKVVTLAYLPLALVEAVMTGFLVGVLRKVKPDILAQGIAA